MNVLIFATRALPASAVADVRREFAAVGAVAVDVVSWLPVPEAVAEEARRCVVAGPVDGLDSPSPARPGLWRAVARKLRRLVRGGVSRGLWRAVRRRADVMAVAGEADVIAAMDSGAIRTSWRLARRCPAAVVTLGVGAAARELAARQQSPAS